MGKRYLDYLIEHDLADSPQYVLAEQSIQQGKKYYADQDYAYRETMLVQNFMREFDMLPFDNYPMNIELNQIYVIDYTYTDGFVERMMYRFDGYMWNGRPTTEQIVIL